MKILILNSFNNVSIDSNKNFKEFVSENNRIMIFKLINYLIENKYLFNEIQFQIFNLLFRNEISKSSNQISLEFNLTNERVRQIKTIFKSRIEDFFNFILNFKIENLE